MPEEVVPPAFEYIFRELANCKSNTTNVTIVVTKLIKIGRGKKKRIQRKIYTLSEKKHMKCYRRQTISFHIHA